MLRTLLITLDGSGLAERGLSVATALSIPTAARLVLLRVNSSPAPADTYLDETASALREHGFVVETIEAAGENVSDAILEHAQASHADLIVSTTHGRSGLARWLLGSVAEALIARSPVPVLLQHAWDPGRRALILNAHPRIVVPLDTSEFAEAALPVALELAEDIGADLLLVHGQGDVPSRAGREYLDKRAEAVRREHPDVAVTTHVEPSDPVTAIVEATDEAEAAMVVMTTHARTGFARATLGSVADGVLRHGKAPLVLVRPTSLSTRAMAGTLFTADKPNHWPEGSG